MPVPAEYQRIRDDFYAFLVDAREQSGLGSSHQTYTMVQGVFQVFRRRLELKDAIRFAGVLPAGLRALFVADWDVDEPRQPFESVAVMTREVRMLREKHNFAPESAIRDVAITLRRYVDVAAFERILNQLPKEAAEFWRQ